ncbi:TIGR03546 family protein [bacterium]|nr:TIGR03546 family protein [bacterium]
MILLKLLGKLIKALKSADSPRQMAWGFVLGTFLGMMPVNSLFAVIILLVLFILNVNFASAMLAFALYSFLAIFLDPVFHHLGFFFLVQVPLLKPVWILLYNWPVAPLMRFNNTVVMGSFAASVFLLIPHYIFFRWFVKRYRESWNEKVTKWKIVQILKGSKLVQSALKAKGIGG